MRIIFFGTPDFAVASLEALLKANYNVVAVVTATDKPAGRGHKLQPSAVKECALKHDLPVLQPNNLKSEEFISALKGYAADIQIVVAFRMLPKVVWNMPPLGTYNVHASLLPNYRGAAPINWAIINGESHTGVTTFKLQHAIDTGSILLQDEVEIGQLETAGELYARLMQKGADLLVRSMAAISKGDFELRPQAEESGKHAPKIFKEDARLSLDQSAENVHNFIRGMSPFPGAYVELINDETQQVERWKILRSAPAERSFQSNTLLSVLEKRLYLKASDGMLEILELQLPGKPKMEAAAFINGYGDRISKLKLRAKKKPLQ